MAKTKGQGNPNWTKDETLLALDLYLRCDGQLPGEESQEVAELSSFLRKLPHHQKSSRQESFRNANGVYLKLKNLRKVATGDGMGNYSKMDEVVWREFGSTPQRVKVLAAQIHAGVQLLNDTDEAKFDDVEFSEGRTLTKVHFSKERNPSIRKALLADRKKRDGIKCDICSCVSPKAEFSEAIFEVHHLTPLSMSSEKKTKLKDVVLLCANCHRLTHRLIAQEKRWMSLDDLRKRIL